jgi:hypothetical protein
MAKPDAPASPRPARARVTFAKGDWRKAFIMQELLSQPLSVR